MITNSSKTSMAAQIILKKRINSQNKIPKEIVKLQCSLNKSRPQWNSLINDLEKYKLSDKEIVALLDSEKNRFSFKK